MYLHLGMTLKKVHRVIQFEQGECMARWVNIFTSKRAQAKNEFEKQFWKLMVRIQTWLFSIDGCCHSLKNQSTFLYPSIRGSFDLVFIIYQ